VIKTTPHRRLNRMSGISSYVVYGILALCAALPAAAVEPGRTAPQIDAPRLGGSDNLALSDFRGKVVYIDFWASWCGPCLNALPALEKLRAEFPSADFQILAVNLDKKPKKALKLVEKFNIGYPSVSDPAGSLPASYGLETMPTSYLIDRNGIVRYVHEGFRSGDIDRIRHEIKRWVRR
jgi:thiol-disulfide isomerase/thioredoxin